jgi:hypothetical protein
VSGEQGMSGRSKSAMTLAEMTAANVKVICAASPEQ